MHFALERVDKLQLQPGKRGCRVAALGAGCQSRLSHNAAVEFRVVVEVIFDDVVALASLRFETS